MFASTLLFWSWICWWVAWCPIFASLRFASERRCLKTTVAWLTCHHHNWQYLSRAWDRSRTILRKQFHLSIYILRSHFFYRFDIGPHTCRCFRPCSWRSIFRSRFSSLTWTSLRILIDFPRCKRLNNEKDTHAMEFAVIVAAFIAITVLEFLRAFSVFDSVQEIACVALLFR